MRQRLHISIAVLGKMIRAATRKLVNQFKRIEKILKNERYEKLEAMGSYLETQLTALIDANNYPLCLQRVGSMFSLFFHLGPINNALDVDRCDFDGFRHYFHSLLHSQIELGPAVDLLYLLSLSQD